MKKKQYFIGIDIGSEIFVATILNSKVSYTQEFKNSTDGFDAFIVWLKINKATTSKSIIVMEATGVYCEQLCYYLYSKEYDFCVETPLKVKRAFDLSPKKSDIIDSKRIAEYALRFFDQLKLWQPSQEILEEIGSLLSLREHLVGNNTANKNALKSLKKKVVKSHVAIEIIESQIIELTEKVKIVEKEIKELLLRNNSIGTQYLLLISIPGVGLLLASELLVLTNSFTKTVEPREITSYMGICPHEYSSGKSVFRKAKSAGYGHSRLRKLIYLASCSIRTHNDNFSNYFNRKVKEGKNGKLIINNIANKLIKIICGVIKSGKGFIPNYQSLSPVLSK